MRSSHHVQSQHLWFASGLPSENFIAQKFFDQLQVIGSRLDNLEKETITKTNDKAKVKSTGAGTVGKGTGKCKQSAQACGSSSAMPIKGSLYPSVSDTGNLLGLENLRQNAFIQQSLEDRIMEFQQLNRIGMPSKLKSRRDGSVKLLVKKRVKLHTQLHPGREYERKGHLRQTHDGRMDGRFLQGHERKTTSKF